jgi:hypothetical protein
VPTHALSAAEVAHLVHAIALGGDAPSPVLVLVEQDAEGVSLLVAPPDEHGPDLFEQAFGLVAPDGCAAVAMASSGRAWRAGGAAFDVVIAHALLRSGPSATYLTDPAGEPLLLDGTPDGQVPDLCRRVLGMPTPPPDLETDGYLTRLWLDRLLGAAAAHPGGVGRVEALALHPAAQASSFGDELTWLHVAVATYQFGVTVPWAVLRRRFAGGDDDRAARAADWFDDGSFSRWMLAQLPAPEDALSALEELLPAATHREVGAVVALTEELGHDDEGEWEDEQWLDDLDDEEEDARWGPTDPDRWGCS